MPVTDEILTQWRLDPSGHIDEIKKVAAEHKKAERNMQNLEYLQGKINGEIDAYGRKVKQAGEELEKASGGAGNLLGTLGKFAGAAIGIGSVTAALSMLKEHLVESFNKGIEFIDKVGGAGTEVAMLRESVDGMVGDKALNKLVQLGDNLGFTGQQMQIVAKAGVEYARVTNGDNAQSIEMLTDKIVSGRGLIPALKKLGIHIEEDSTKSISQSEALKLLSEKFEGVTIKAEDASEAWDKVRAAQERYEGLGGAVLVKQIQDLGGIDVLLKTCKEDADRLALATGRIGQISAEGLERQQELLQQQVASVTEASATQIKYGIEAERNYEQEQQNYELLQKINREWMKRGDIAQGVHKRNAEWLEAALGDKKAETQLTEKYKSAVARAQDEAAKESYEKSKSAAIAAAKKRKQEEFKALKESLEVTPEEIADLNAAREQQSKEIDKMFADREASQKRSQSVELAAMMAGNQENFKQRDELEADYRSAKKLADLYGVNFDKALLRAGGDLKKLNTELKKNAEITSGANTKIKDLAVSGLTDLAGAMWSAADAALSGGESFGAAMSKIVKSTLLGKASIATVEALYETGKGFAALFFNPAEAEAHFIAAAKFYATAAVAGSAGLAMSSGGVGGTAGGSAAGGTPANYSDRYGQQAEYKPTQASSQEKEQTFNVTLYLGDSSDPGTAMMMTKAITTQVKKAA